MKFLYNSFSKYERKLRTWRKYTWQNYLPGFRELENCSEKKLMNFIKWVLNCFSCRLRGQETQK
jgi:hypothetical protein